MDAGLDYPRTLSEFDRRFATEADCREYLVGLRWPQGFKCPECASGQAWITRRHLMHCRGCGHQVSVTAGTIFHRSRYSLRVWFQVMWWLTGQKTGASALGLQRIVGLGSYRTAWNWLHKLRRAMVRPDREALTGEVEVDETFIGASEVEVGRRLVGNKALVAIACEIRGKALGRIRLESIPDATAPTLQAFVKRSVASGSVLITDGWRAYLSLAEEGYIHRPRVQRRPQDASRLLPRVHRVASLLKRWLLGTHHGRVERSHLPYYLDEFTFRFNRRSSKSRGLLFYRLAHQAIAMEPILNKTLIGGTR
jgi:transposase-like protein